MNTSSFSLHPQLAGDTQVVGDLSLCQLLLMNDARFPWCILVPKVDGVREIHRLTHDAQTTLFEEVVQVSATMERLFKAEKMNVAALGNQVPQLHVHVIARMTTDAAWPRPVWGVGQAVSYAQADLNDRVTLLRKSLSM